ncbi:gastrula zinc finger protein XlCGF26.1-like [Ochlerotatus camptorhynchus]|uniref:gastrula zinc finger protein XlCGF26.1-like n=1 Tax=Ochlerotatus camptorhynchus TaxID=644619 RepID=UPI0031D0E19C
MEFISCESVCRCCLTNAGNFTSIFEIYNDYYLPKVIHACTGLTINQSDGFPEVVCETCLMKLVTAYETRRLFIRSNGQLKEQLNRLKQSEQEILSELNSTAAKCAASTVEDGGSSLLNVDSILDTGPITTWDNEINMHIEQLQDGTGELATNIEDCLDELVIEKCENLEKGGYSFPVSEPVVQSAEGFDGVIGGVVCSSPRNEETTEEEQQDGEEFPPFSDYSESSEEGQEADSNDRMETEQEETQNCPICGKTYRNARLLQRHVQYHNASSSDCPICSKSFTHTSNLKRHLNSHKPPPEGFSCSKCTGKFDKGAQLYNHLKLHKASNDTDSYRMQCDRCEMETTSLAGFVYHMSQEHGVTKDQVKAFRCHLCTLRFVSKQGMGRHIQSVHQNQKPVQNNTKKFQCTECGKCFQRMRHLEAHANSHAGIRPYACGECGLSFSQQSGLNLHIRAKHKNQKNHVCKICRKSFSQSTHLKHHELIHSNRKEHECTVCKHRFRVKSNLMAHMRIHRRHPYCCADCGREFMQSARLEQHMLTEHGGK